MKRTISLHIQELPDGVFTATSPDMPGLAVQEYTLAETLETACDLTKRMIELKAELKQSPNPSVQTVSVKTPIDIPLEIGFA